MLSIKTPKDVADLLALRLKQQRLRLGYSRNELAEKSGVSSASIKRFERTGEIALKRLLMLCLPLGLLMDFDQVLKPPAIRSIRELKYLDKERQRGRRRSS